MYKESSVNGAMWRSPREGYILPPGKSHFFACKYVSNIRSLYSIYPIGSDMITSTFSGSSISSIFPGITVIESSRLFAITSFYIKKKKKLKLVICNAKEMIPEHSVPLWKLLRHIFYGLPLVPQRMIIFRNRHRHLILLYPTNLNN